MASLTVNVLGITRVVEEVGNPFAFCRSYDEAARRSGDDVPGLSAKALRFLELLEAKYTSSSEF